MFLLRINYYLINLSSNTNDLKYWKNTKTLDNLVPELLQTCDPSEADIAVIGSKKIDLDSMPSLRGIFKCGGARPRRRLPVPLATRAVRRCRCAAEFGAECCAAFLPKSACLSPSPFARR